MPTLPKSLVIHRSISPVLSRRNHACAIALDQSHSSMVPTGCYTGSTHSRSAFCGEVDSKSEKAGSSFATHDEAPLVTALPQNNIQVMHADAWRPLRYRAEIYEGVGHAYLVPGRAWAPSFCSHNELWHWAHQAQIRWKVICRLWFNSLEHSSCQFKMYREHSKF